jgi:hypothetical protein
MHARLSAQGASCRWDVPPHLRLLTLELEGAAALLAAWRHEVMLGVARISNAVRQNINVCMILMDGSADISNGQ